MSDGEPLMDFKQGPRWSDLFPFLLKFFIHPFLQQVFIIYNEFVNRKREKTVKETKKKSNKKNSE